MPTWTKALIGYSNPGAATTLGSISLYSRPLFSIFGFITRLFISTQMLYFPFWLEKYFFDQDLHYCRGMDKPQICVKKLWRHLSPAFERLSLIIHLLRLPTRFWNVSIFLFLLNVLIIPSYLGRLLVQGPLLDFGRNPVLFPCVWLYRQGVLTPWSRNRLLVDLSLCLLVTTISHITYA